jgi:hypothetical protein
MTTSAPVRRTRLRLLAALAAIAVLVLLLRSGFLAPPPDDSASPGPRDGGHHADRRGGGPAPLSGRPSGPSATGVGGSHSGRVDRSATREGEEEDDFRRYAPFEGPRIGSSTGAPEKGNTFSQRRRRLVPATPPGGGQRTLGTVDLALEWLADHQEKDGSWDPAALRSRESGVRSPGGGQSAYRTGVTAVATLAFLGAGETHKAGPHRKTVKDAIKYLKCAYDPDGRFVPADVDEAVLAHAWATQATAEIYALTRSPLFKSMLFAVREAPRLGPHGRRGLAASRGFPRHRHGRDDLGSAGPRRGAAGAAGRGAGGGARGGPRLPGASDRLVPPASSSRPGTPTTSSTATCGSPPAPTSPGSGSPAAASRISPGWPPSSASTRPPVWEDDRIDVHLWHLGTSALFQHGGPAWQAWNRAMKEALVDSQRRDGDRKGSWDPIGPWAEKGGRVWSTAMLAMCLEVYYRYRRVAER